MTKIIKLTKGYEALVDDEDYDRLNQYHYAAEVKKRTGLVYASRAIVTYRWYMAWDVLEPKDGFLIDHVNRATLDNKRSNLRYATRSQSNANTKTYAASGYRGVYKLNEKLWVVSVKHGGWTYRLGCFTDKIEAAKAYDKCAREVHGEFATLNFPSC